MHQAVNVQFERAVDEFVRWRAVPEQARSPAPAWWWGPAFEALGVQQPMPAAWCASLELPERATYADGARIFLKCLAGRTRCHGPAIFPERQRIRIPLDGIRCETGAGSTTNSSILPLALKPSL